MTRIPPPGVDGVGIAAAIPPPGGHGGDGARIAAALGLRVDEVLDLSASMNPVAPDVSALVADHLDAIGRYPDAGAATEALAGALQVDAGRVLLTNGGAEAIALVAAVMVRGWVEEPDFSLYARHLAIVEPGAPRWRSDPHSPDGRLAGAEERASVWDEAFYPLATGRWTSGRSEDGAIIVGSLTKVFACPGLRIGFVLAPAGPDGAQLIARAAAAQPRWSVNGLAAAVLPALLAAADLGGWAREVARLRGELETALVECGLRPVPSDVNYLLVPDARGLRDALARKGVVVRDCASFGLEDHVRIAVPDDAGRARLITAVRSALGVGAHS